MDDYGTSFSDLSAPRSVNLAHDSGVPQPLEGLTHRFNGDFYSELNDVTRGATLAPADPMLDSEVTDHCTGSLGAYGSLDFSPDLNDMGMASVDFPQEIDVTLGSRTVEPALLLFSSAYEPPEVPKDPYFKLAVTTIPLELVATELSAIIGNTILKFLSTKVHSSITKVRPERHKSWIKADVFATSIAPASFAMCTLKVRIYKIDSVRGYATEFTRCSGDSLTFSWVYQQAVQYFHSPEILVHMKVMNDDPSNPPPEIGVIAPPSLSVAGGDPQASLAPVLDMAAMKSQPSLQAESAATLAEIAERDTGRAAGLCTTEVFEAIRHLLHADLTAVVFPTARLLCQLAGCQAAEPLFADGRILEDVLSKIRSSSAAQCSLVTGQLAQVMSVSLERFAQNFTADSAKGLWKGLKKAIEEVSCDWAKKNLEQALQHTATKLSSTALDAP